MKFSKTTIYILIFLFNIPLFSQSFARCNSHKSCSIQSCKTDHCETKSHKNIQHKEDGNPRMPCPQLADACFYTKIGTQAIFHEQKGPLWLPPSLSQDIAKTIQYSAFYRFVLLNPSPRTNNSLYILQSKLIC